MNTAAEGSSRGGESGSVVGDVTDGAAAAAPVVVVGPGEDLATSSPRTTSKGASAANSTHNSVGAMGSASLAKVVAGTTPSSSRQRQSERLRSSAKKQ